MKKQRMQALVKGACMAGVAVLALGGCSGMEKHAEPYRDAKRSVNCEPKDWAVNRAPDGFSNTATACLLKPVNGGCGRSGVRITVMYKNDDTTRGAIATTPDENC